jgi:hypothetical protein
VAEVDEGLGQGVAQQQRAKARAVDEEVALDAPAVVQLHGGHAAIGAP